MPVRSICIALKNELLDWNQQELRRYLSLVAKAQQEIKRLNRLAGEGNPAVNVNELRKELEGLAQENLDKATFAEKRDIIIKLGIRVYPSEDLKAVKIRCSPGFRNDGYGEPFDRCGIIQIASPGSE